MRIIVTLAFLLSALVSFAGGVALTPTPNLLHQADQVVLIDLQPDKVTVDMFITLEGIPIGKRVAYVLPCLYKPEEFSFEDMSANDFQTNYLKPAQKWVSKQHTATDTAKFNSITDTYVASFGGFGLMGLGLAVVIPSLMGPSRDNGKHNLSPYNPMNVPVAHAEVYPAAGQDLAALVARAGLPSRYARVLQRYHTPYFAVVNLKGIGVRDKDRGESDHHPQGFHYHYTHHMSNQGTYTYTYPFGAGAGMANPINFVDVYIRCPEGWYLDVSAPAYGEMRSYIDVLSQSKHLLLLDADERKRYEKPRTMTGKVPYLPLRYPYVWHRGYSYIQPSEDIVVKIAPRPMSFLYRLASFFSQGWIIGLLTILNLFAAWFIAIHFHLRRRWRESNSETRFSSTVIFVLRNAALWGAIIGVVGLGSLLNRLVKGAIDEWRILYLFVPILFVYLVALIMTYRQGEQGVGLRGDSGKILWKTYLVAISWYSAFSIVLVLFTWLFDWLRAT